MSFRLPSERRTAAATSPRFPFVARTLAAAGVLLVAAASASHAQTQWVVDASGGGDFTDLQAAITQAAPGDVLRILPGNYAAAELTKSLSLIGNPDLPKPILAVLDIQAAPNFSLQHLHLRRLRVEGGESRSVIDFCQIGQMGLTPLLPGPVWGGSSHFQVRNAPDLVLSSSEVIGGLGGGGADGGVGMEVAEGSLVHILQTTVRAQNAVHVPGYGPGYAEDGLRVSDGSVVWLTASSVFGGIGQDGPLWDPGDGKNGNGVYLQNGGRLYARGRSDHQIQGGVLCDIFAGPALFYSGINVPATPFCAQPFGYNEPFLMAIGQGQVGSNKRVWFYGEAGTPAVLLASLAPAALPLDGLFGTPLWVDPGQLLLAQPLVTTGFSTPVIQTFPLPATSALAGLQVYLQGVQPVSPNVWRATNLANISLNW